MEKCPRKRFWLTEYQGKGLERINDLKLDARIGTGAHAGIEYGIEMVTKDIPGPSIADAAIDSADDFFEQCHKTIGTEVAPPDQLIHDIKEGAQIVTALVYAWLRVVAPRLLADGEVLAIEKELTVDFRVPTPAGGETVRLLARPDTIWKRKSDGTIFVRNLKTVRKADDRFREKWALDQQTLSEPLAVDAWLKGYKCETDPDQNVLAPSCGGVIIDGLVTGEVLFDKYRGLFYHNNPLIYAWEGSDIGIVDHKEFYPKYEWTCTGPHKFKNGRKCEGGKTHKLSGVRKVSVADNYPGGIIAWIDYLISNYPDVVAECIVELPPIIRSDYQIERWKRQVLRREVDIHNHGAQCNATFDDSHLDAAFPMHTSNGNCLYPGKCQFFDLCHGSAAADPLGSGLYQFRVPNHPTEGE